MSPDWHFFYPSPGWTSGSDAVACLQWLHRAASSTLHHSTGLGAFGTELKFLRWLLEIIQVVCCELCCLCLVFLKARKKPTNRCQRINREFQPNTCRCRQSGLQPLFWELIYSLAPRLMLFHLLTQPQPKWIIIFLSAPSQQRCFKRVRCIFFCPGKCGIQVLNMSPPSSAAWNCSPTVPFNFSPKKLRSTLWFLLFSQLTLCAHSTICCKSPPVILGHAVPHQSSNYIPL